MFGRVPRALVPAKSSSHALRAVMLVALASGMAACDAREWPSEASRAAHRAGVWIGVIDEPRPIAGEQAVVMPAPSTSTSSSAP